MLIGWGLLFPAWMVGLFGGGMYAATFTLIPKEVEPDMVEFSMATATMAQMIGATLASLVAIPVQDAMWKKLGIGLMLFQITLHAIVVILFS